MSHICACIDELVGWVFVSDDLIFEEEGEEKSMGYYPASRTTPNSPFPPAYVMSSACAPFVDEEETAKRPRPLSSLLTPNLALRVNEVIDKEEEVEIGVHQTLQFNQHRASSPSLAVLAESAACHWQKPEGKKTYRKDWTPRSGISSLKSKGEVQFLLRTAHDTFLYQGSKGVNIYGCRKHESCGNRVRSSESWSEGGDVQFNLEESGLHFSTLKTSSTFGVAHGIKERVIQMVRQGVKPGRVFVELSRQGIAEADLPERKQVANLKQSMQKMKKGEDGVVCVHDLVEYFQANQVTTKSQYDSITDIQQIITFGEMQMIETVT